jgi:hypothetical protein
LYNFLVESSVAVAALQETGARQPAAQRPKPSLTLHRRRVIGTDGKIFTGYYKNFLHPFDDQQAIFRNASA